MFGIVSDEVREQSLELGLGKNAPFRYSTARDHHARADADQLACAVIGYRRCAFACEHRVQGIDQIGRGIDERTVEVEDKEGVALMADR